MWVVNIYNKNGTLVCYNSVPTQEDGYKWIERHPCKSVSSIIMKVERSYD